MTDRDLLSQALDALEDAVGLHVRWDDAHAETIAALREALAAPQAEPWMPIETAPKDGSMFLVWISGVLHGEDDNGQQYQQEEGQVDFAQWRTFECGGYVDCFGNPYPYDQWGATHWMPLPAAPGATPPLDGFGGNLDAAFDTAPSNQLSGISGTLNLIPAPVPDGMVMVPDYRGYAALGTGQYLLDISGDANPAELIIHVATDAEKEGRTVGDLRDKGGPGEVIQPEKMAVRLAFFTVAGLDALEQQLRILRETHFAESAAPVVREPLPGVLDPDCNYMAVSGRVCNKCGRIHHGIGGGGNG